MLAPESIDGSIAPADGLANARLVAVGAGGFWLVLGIGLAFMALFAAAVAVPALLILGPWALAALVLAALLLGRPPTKRVLRTSIVIGTISLAFGVLLLLGSSEDFLAGSIVFTVSSAGAALYSFLAIRRLPPLVVPPSPELHD